ncbi:hypothetical protein Pcinc_000408 [Petrolisthes cinctipes]|uniref:Retrotransposon gag domain-containing protein n=1 Tax=Petrolisthes cinctipes TaxID=88211 RepID=A0AAE1GS56_PETCI|nr:hypothetical protein Pcinc_000408 [Petrolisthes cinctipes]
MPLDVAQPPAFSVVADPSSVASRWKKWTQAFTFYLDATGVTNAVQKRALFLHIAGQEVQEIFDTFSGELDTFEKAISALDKYFVPLVNMRYERVLFRQIHQESNEPTDTFVTRLRKLAESCNFHDSEDAILDQAIEKCASSQLRRKVLQERNITLDKFLQIARAMEAADRHADIIEGSSNGRVVQVNYVKHKKSKPHVKDADKGTQNKPVQEKYKGRTCNRTTEHAVTGLTPSNLLMGRRIRNKLDLLKPDYHAHQNQKKWKQLVPQKTPHYTTNSLVLVRSYGTTEKWVPGKIQNELGNLHSEVDVDGRILKRHVDQLLPSPVKETHLDSVKQPNDIHDSNTVDTGGTRVLPERKTRRVPPVRLDL